MGAHRLTEEREAELVQLYAGGMPVSELRKRFGVVVTSIPRIARRHGVPVRPQKRPAREFTDAELQEMRRLWHEERWSQTKIGEAFDASQIVVSRALRNARIEGPEPLPKVEKPPYVPVRGAEHGAWKGGRVRNGDYWAVYVAPDDPLASMRQNQSYVMEHRLVMARALGRPLRKTETVHHVNGDKTDNRLENLQLRSGRHGRGVVLRCRSCGSHDVEPVDL